MSKKNTINSIKLYKNQKKIIMITAYDAMFANLFHKSSDIILVGDSLNMSFYGKSDTISTTLKQMIYHTKAVCNGAPDSFVVCDMPFSTYTNKKDALKNSSLIYRKTKADAIKLEGGKNKAHIIKYLTTNSIGVMGHIGLLPQDFRNSGYRVQGTDSKSKQRLLDDAKAVEDAGAFALVIEGVPSDVGLEITQSIKIPTIGIGAGKYVDGQVLVWSDMLGFFQKFSPKFVRKYVDGASIVLDALEKFSLDVENGDFPNANESYK
jgi:3-methyl-2-oxobutanoate hydroxymethyltransferase